jgi:hypothetical protein
MVWNRHYGADGRGYRRLDLVCNARRQKRKQNQVAERNVPNTGEKSMNAATTYNHYCSTCKEDTLHVPKYEKMANTVIKTAKIIVFFVSFGMAYPHIFAGEDEITVKCEKCGTKVASASE